jgi:outer membrane lipoprotein-sorting protein
LEGIKDLSSLSEVTQVMPQGDMTINMKAVALLPDKVRTDAVTPFGPFVMATDGTAGWMKTPQGSGALPPAQLENLKKSLTRLPSVLLLSALDEDRPVQFLETAEVDGSEADVIVVPDAAGENIKLYVEQGSGHIIKRSLQAEVPGKGPVQQEQVFSDFREVSGLTMPFKEVTYHDGERAGERTVKSVEINTGVDPAIFAPEEE